MIKINETKIANNAALFNKKDGDNFDRNVISGDPFSLFQKYKQVDILIA